MKWKIQVFRKEYDGQRLEDMKLADEHMLAMKNVPMERVCKHYDTLAETQDIIETTLFAGLRFVSTPIHPVRVFGLSFYAMDILDYQEFPSYGPDYKICRLEGSTYILNPDHNVIWRHHRSDFSGEETLVYEKWELTDAGDD